MTSSRGPSGPLIGKFSTARLRLHAVVRVGGDTQLAEGIALDASAEADVRVNYTARDL